MANRGFDRQVGSVRKGVVKLYGRFTTTTSGTISTVAGSFTSARQAGFSVVKTATKTGRYTVTLQDKFTELCGVHTTVIGTADAAYVAGKGFVASFVRNDAASTSKTFDIQFTRINGTTDYADTELADAAVVLIEITLTNSSV